LTSVHEIDGFQFSLGYAIEHEDYEYLTEKGREFELVGAYTAPDQIDPSSWLCANPKNQLRKNSCTGFGTTCAARITNWIGSEGTQVDLSEDFTYLTGQKEAGIRGDNGGTIAAVVQATKKYGLCREETMPYSEQYVTTVPREAFDEAGEHLIQSHTSLYSYEDVFKFLSAGIGAVVIGIPWVESLARHRGTDPVEEVSGQVYGAHCVALGGYSSRQDDRGDKYLLLFNSHGPEWGDRGRAEIAPNVVRRWANGQSNSMIGISDMQVYKAGRADWIRRDPFFHGYKF
jgi:hypothetical protein